MKNEKVVYRLAIRPLLATAVILAAPLVAMQFTDEVVWTLSDFVIMGALVAGTGLLFELALIEAESTMYRAATGIALAAVFLLIWVNLAVGIIGAQDNAANLMYAGVLAVAVGGAVGAGFEARGMARAMVATALAHVTVGVIALMGGLGSAWHVVGLTGMFAALFIGSALLFGSAATRRSDAVAQPAR